MKITAIASPFAALATGAAVIAAPTAFADDHETQALGQQAELVNGDVSQGWTVSNLAKSSDVIPYAVQGTLWEATATDVALRGSVTPIVSNLNARAKNGQTYRSLFGVATPQGVNPSTLAQGQKTTGKVYFDVTGDAPDSVVYNSGGNDLAVWTQPAPSAGTSSSPAAGAGGHYRAGPGGGRSDSPAAGVPATPAGQPGLQPPSRAPETVPTGSSGTPITPGSEGTSLPQTAPGQPAPDAPAPGTPVPGGTAPGTPAPGGTAPGAPAPGGTAPAPGATAPGAPAPGATAPGTPIPAGSQGTPTPGAAVPAGNQAGAQGVPAANAGTQPVVLPPA